MIGIRISGGLGNQLFQYAFISNSGLKKKKLFFLLKDGAPIELYKYFKLKRNLFYIIDVLFFNHDGFKLFFSHYLRSPFYRLIQKVFIKNLVSSPKGTDSPNTLSDKGDATLFNGYFQSPLYFSEHKTEVLKYLELKNSIIKSYNKNYPFPRQESKIVTVHVRKSDFLDLGSYNLGDADLSLPFSYYHQLIKEIHTDTNYYIIISDMPEIAAGEFDYLERKYISKDNVIVDFQHMLNADVCIIANSTFSWWAAYLNNNKHKVVYCPRHFLGYRLNKEYPMNIYPDDWIEVDVPTNVN